MGDLSAVEVEFIVIESAVSDEADPLRPSRGDVVSLILIQVFTKIT